MEATSFSENLVNLYQWTLRQGLEQLNVYQHHYDKLKPREVCPSWSDFTFLFQLRTQMTTDFGLRFHPL